MSDQVSITVAAERIRSEFGRLDLLINNAAISRVENNDVEAEDYAAMYSASTVSIDEFNFISILILQPPMYRA